MIEIQIDRRLTLICIKIFIYLIKNNFLEYFCNTWNNGYRPIVAWITLSTTLKYWCYPACLHSRGNIPVLIDAVNISFKEGAITSAAIFNNLFGMLSRPTDFFSSILLSSQKTVSTVGVCNEKDLAVGLR